MSGTTTHHERLIREDVDSTYYPDTHTFDTENKDWISKITHKAQYMPSCCEGWRHSEERLGPYTAVAVNTCGATICLCIPGCNPHSLHVLFYSYTAPFLVALLAGWCNFIPPNCICPVEDQVKKMYFDDGYFSREHIGCADITGPTFVGAPKAFKLNDHLTCCCLSPTVCGLNFCCGDIVAIEPFQSFYQNCMDAKTMFLCNCCGCCGLKSGSPLCCVPLTCHLREKEGDMLVDAINNSYTKWVSRTRILKDRIVEEQPRAPSECPYEPTRAFSTDNQAFELKDMKT